MQSLLVSLGSLNSQDSSRESADILVCVSFLSLFVGILIVLPVSDLCANKCLE